MVKYYFEKYYGTVNRRIVYKQTPSLIFLNTTLSDRALRITVLTHGQFLQSVEIFTVFAQVIQV